MSFETTPPFTAADAANAWNEGADAYDEFVQSGADFYRLEVHGPALVAACGEVGGLRVLDLGCGQGYLCRQLAERGAQVIGVDVSDKLIGHARRHERDHPLGIQYEVMDAARVHQRWTAGDFDLVTACMSIHDMPEPARALASAAGLLTAGARLVYSTPNPTTDTPYREWKRDEQGNKLALEIDRYFESGPGVMHWNMPRLRSHWHSPRTHSTLSEMTAMIAAAGLLLRRIDEPRATPEQVARRPKLEDCARLPYFLVFDCVKAEG